jgi:2'-5' RNA ligase
VPQRHCREWEWPENQAHAAGRHHLTLHFLGDSSLAPEQRLRKALREVAVEALEIELRRFGKPATCPTGALLLVAYSTLKQHLAIYCDTP